MEVKDLYIVVDLYPELAKPLQEGLHQHLKNQFRRMPGQKWYHVAGYCFFSGLHGYLLYGTCVEAASLASAHCHPLLHNESIHLF